MKRYNLLVLLLFSMTPLMSQVVVEKANFAKGEFTVLLPKLVDQSNDQNKAVNKINQYILEYFDIESFDPEQVEDFRWTELDFQSEINNEILYLYLNGTYYGAYPNDVSESLFFDLQTGEKLHFQSIPFQSLFTLDGYLGFLNQYWMEGIRAEFQQAIDCAETEPYCSYYDIEYEPMGTALKIALVDDCYARVVRACSPFYDLTLKKEMLEKYLSELGSQYVVTDEYPKKMGVERYLVNKKLIETIPNYVYLFGKIDRKYAFSMALTFSNTSDEVSGYYFYNNQRKKIQLKGTEGNRTIDLTERLNGEVTGSFHLEWEKQYSEEKLSIYLSDHENHYLGGNWTNADSSKKMPIEFTEVKFNDRN